MPRIDLQVNAQNQTENITYALTYLNFSENTIYTAYFYTNIQWMSAIYSGLLKRSSLQNHWWVPDIALSLPTVSDDKMTYTFQLKENLYFSNSKPLTADDVEFSLKVFLSPDINTQLPYSIIPKFIGNSSFNAISDIEFSITLIKPYTSSVPYALFTFPLIPKETFDKRYQNCIGGVKADCVWNANDGSDTISAGPFVVQGIDNITKKVTLIANPHYYNADKVLTDKLVFQELRFDNAISLMRSNSVDIMDYMYGNSLQDLLGTDISTSVDGVSVIWSNLPINAILSLNHRHPYFGTGELIPNSIGQNNKSQVYENARLLRKAISLAVDRESLLDWIYYTHGSPIAIDMNPAQIGFDTSIAPDTYNLTTARHIMTQLGFDYNQLGTPNNENVYPKSFFNITISHLDTGGSVMYGYTYLFKDILAKIGIGVDTQLMGSRFFARSITSPVDPPLYVDGGFDMQPLDWYSSLDLHSSLDWNPYAKYDSNGSCTTGDCRNYINFDLNESMTPIASLVQSYLNEWDYNKMIVKSSQLQHALDYWIPTIPLFAFKNRWGISNQVIGIDPILLGTTSQEWDMVAKSWFQPNQKIEGPGSVTTEKSSISLSSIFIFGFPVIIFLKKRSYLKQIA